MGKRVADSELNQDNWQNETASEESDGPFKAAAKQELQKRKIKALPSRRSAASSPQPATSTPPPPPISNGLTANDDNQKRQQYLNIRGLNVSVISNLQDLIDKDPFVDLTQSLQKLATRYAEERSKIDSPSSSQQETNGASKPASASYATSNSEASTPPSSSGSTAPTAPDSTPPIVPKGAFIFAGKPVPSTTSTQPTSGGFTFDSSQSTASASSSPFKLPVAPTAPTLPALGKIVSAAPSKPSPLRMAENVDSSPSGKSEDAPKKANAFAGFTFGPATSQEVPKPPAASKPAFSFASTTATASSPETNQSKPVSAFGTPATTETSSPFSFSAAPKSDVAPKPAFSFSSEVPNSTSTSEPPKSAFTFGSVAKPDQAATKPSPFSFGNTPISPAKPASVGFGFGMSPPSSKPADAAAPSTGFSFGQPAASSSTPSVGFGFGAGSSPFSFAMGSTSESKPALNPAAPAFSFGASTPVSAAPSEINSESPLVAEEETPANAKSENPFTKESEAEAGEDVLAEVRAAMHTLVSSEWKKDAIGVFKLRQNTESGKVRMVGRHSTNGSIMLNFLLYKGMKVTQTDKTIAFTGFLDSDRKSVRLRVKEASMAIAFKEAIESHLPA